MQLNCLTTIEHRALNALHNMSAPRAHVMQTGRRRRSWLLAGAQVFALCLLSTPQLKASFIQAYDLSQFTLTNTNADGTAMSPDGGLSLILTGGNNGSGLSGTTDFVMVATLGGLISFDYTYSACSQTDICDTPGFDFGGYLLNTNFTQIADTTGMSGAVSFGINPGDTFGFRVGTADNTGEPGILTISNFSGPEGASGVPEPTTAPVICLIAGVAIWAQFWRSRNRKSRETNA